MSDYTFRNATPDEVASLKDEHGQIYAINVGEKLRSLNSEAQVIFRHMQKADRAYLKTLTERNDANADEMLAQRLVVFPDVGTYNQMCDVAYGIHASVATQAMQLYGYVEHEAAKKL